MPSLPPPLALSAETPAAPKAAPEPAAYANAFEVGFNAFEFLFDFAQDYDGDEGMATHTRIVTAPAYAKVFRELLDRSIAEYEAAFGAIGPLPPDAPEG